MSEQLHYFQTPQSTTAVALPFVLDALLRDWERLRLPMTRLMPPAFARDEWAYLITFLERGNLRGAFEQTFGTPVPAAVAPVRLFARPRGPVAVWLPNNVSLLGPLTLILLSLTGNRIRLKGGTKSEDLTGAFLEFARQKLGEGPLATHLNASIQYEVFERSDARNAEMAATAMQRIVFGSDAAAAAIHGLPHPLESIGLSFVDRRSEAWIERAALRDDVLRDLLKVFAVYGQAGCTSPRRVILLDGSPDEVLALRDRLVALWPEVIKRKPAPHVASENVMTRQWAAALGWNARLAPDHAAVFAAGTFALSEFASMMGLMCVAASREEAANALSPSLQTIGHAFTNAQDESWLRLLAGSRARRLVPIAQMHHFGPVWDGQPFFLSAFELVSVN